MCQKTDFVWFSLCNEIITIAPRNDSWVSYCCSGL
jgi:hypothetical protein